MTADSADIRSFLMQTPPFDGLEAEQLQLALDKLQAVYVCHDNRKEIMQPDVHQLYLVRSGAYDLVDKDGQHLDRLEPGDLFGYPSLLPAEKLPINCRSLPMGLFGSGRKVYLTNYDGKTKTSSVTLSTHMVSVC